MGPQNGLEYAPQTSIPKRMRIGSVVADIDSWYSLCPYSRYITSRIMSESSVSQSANSSIKSSAPKLTAPYLDLSSTIDIVDTIYSIGGDSCEWGQIAASLKQTPTSGNLRLKMLSGRAFGVWDYQAKTVTLSALGKQILNPETKKKACVDAFLNVPLFSTLFEKFKELPLPADTVLEKHAINIGIVKNQSPKAVRVFKDSARMAGFFEIASDRLTKPSISESTLTEESVGDSVARDVPSDVPPLVQALLQQLPAEGAPWELSKCVAWLEMLKLGFVVMYDNSDELAKIEIRTGNGR